MQWNIICATQVLKISLLWRHIWCFDNIDVTALCSRGKIVLPEAREIGVVFQQTRKTKFVYNLIELSIISKLFIDFQCHRILQALQIVSQAIKFIDWFMSISFHLNKFRNILLNSVTWNSNFFRQEKFERK